jgi:hypothetical protein
MTSPFSKSGRDQTVPDDDPIVPDGDQVVLDDGRTAPADDIRADDTRADGAPASDPIVLDSDQVVLDDDRTAPADDTRADDTGRLGPTTCGPRLRRPRQRDRLDGDIVGRRRTRPPTTFRPTTRPSWTTTGRPWPETRGG